jgi:hypothetical protein
LRKYWAILSKFEHAQIGKVKMEGERLNLVSQCLGNTGLMPDGVLGLITKRHGKPQSRLNLPQSFAWIGNLRICHLTQTGT